MRTSRHPDSMTRTAARTHLAMLLNGATDEKLAGFTAEWLAGTHKVSLAEAELALFQARQNRWHD